MLKRTPSKKEIAELVSAVHVAAQNAQNETQLRDLAESQLEKICKSIGACWSPYTLEQYLRGQKNKNKGKRRFVDAIHGAVVIEYEPPKSFNGKAGAQYRHACGQAEEYAEILSETEGRAINEYILVVWDGETIDFGKHNGSVADWDGPMALDDHGALRLVNAIQSNGRPLVSQLVLAQNAGPESGIGVQMIPLLYNAICQAQQVSPATKTTLLFAEWRRLFGQVVGIGDGPLRDYIQAQTRAHGVNYDANTPAYLFAVNTYIALLAKVVAACALPRAAEDVRDHAVEIYDRAKALEDGTLFRHAGLTNMVSGDFFSWYLDDLAWPKIGAGLVEIITQIADIDFDVAKKSASTTRDLFKGIYETCVPRELRHALGEFYTPDWLAEHGMDTLGWSPENDMLDPTCGSGTFILEALRRRIDADKSGSKSAEQLLDGIYGTDLNPLAVLAAKASLAVFIAPRISAGAEVRLPVFLADAVNPATTDGDYFLHDLPTEKGIKEFRLPVTMVKSSDYYTAMALIQARIDEDASPEDILSELQSSYPTLAKESAHWGVILNTVETIFDLHNVGWNGIWCSILADRFAAGAINNVSHICGNPPWVKWSHLPPEYANFIKPRCQALGVFSQDSWVGGIESDISTVITYEAIDRYLADKGKLGFFITATVFKNESSEGFRKFSLRNDSMQCKVLLVEDYKAIKPFEGVTNHPALLVIEKGRKTTYPVSYGVWQYGAKPARNFSDAKAFTSACKKTELVAKPVPGGGSKDSRPWLVATPADIDTYRSVFAQRCQYQARKGVTTDRNGIFWVDVLSANKKEVVIENLKDIGRTKGIPQRKATVEVEHVFPLIRGKEIQPFKATPSIHILMPQRGMHGEDDLNRTHPKTFSFLKRFKSELEKRSSLRRFQRNKAWYSLWSTGPYTFAPHKIAWREMGGGQFFAAYIGSVNDKKLGQRRVIIPDHKIYFATAETAQEAHFVVGFLNAPCVSRAISSYASQLSLGVSVSEYVGIPKFDKNNTEHQKIAKLSKSFAQKSVISGKDYMNLNSLVVVLL